MALIKWQTNAKRHLKNLFDYYRDHASLVVALSMRDTIMDDVEKLEIFLLWGYEMMSSLRRIRSTTILS